jgi:hypothetical protein
MLESSPHEETWWFDRFNTQLPRMYPMAQLPRGFANSRTSASSEGMVLSDLNSKLQLTAFALTQRPEVQVFFVFSEDGISVTHGTLKNFHQQTRFEALSGVCEASTLEKLKAERAGEPKVAVTKVDADEDACQKGDAKKCFALASNKEDGAALNYYWRACDHGFPPGCVEVAKLYAAVGDDQRAAKYRARACELEPAICR